PRIEVRVVEGDRAGGGASVELEDRLEGHARGAGRIVLDLTPLDDQPVRDTIAGGVLELAQALVVAVGGGAPVIPQGRDGGLAGGEREVGVARGALVGAE